MAGPPRPKNIVELADLADDYLASTWDDSQPIRRWLRAMKHLAIEAKVYENEGELDLAFIRFVTVSKLAEDVLPTHPEWNTLSQSTQATIRSEANALSPSLNSLKAAIHKRSEGFEKTGQVIKVAPGSQPALTLRNTVQPASNSMSSVSAPPIAIIPQAKLGATAKLKKKFGLGPKKAGVVPGGAAGDRLPSSELKRAGTLAEPGAPEEDDNALTDDWTMLEPSAPPESSTIPQAGPSSYGGGRPEVQQQGSGWGAPPPANDFVQNWVNQNAAPPPAQTHYSQPPLNRSRSEQLAMPGDESPDEDEGIAYARGTHQTSWDAVNVRTGYPYGPPPPSAPSSHPTGPPIQNPHWSAPPAVYGHSAPPGWEQPLAGASGIQRTPSRLTTSHQQQQGYYPSLTRNSRHGAASSLPFPAEEFDYAPQDYMMPNDPPRPAHSSLPLNPYTQPPLLPLAQQPPNFSQTSRYATSPPIPSAGAPKPYPPPPASAPPFHLPTMAPPPLERPKPPPAPSAFARGSPTFQAPPLPAQAPPRPPLRAINSQDTTPSAPPESPDSAPSSARPLPSAHVNGSNRLSRSGSMIAMPFLADPIDALASSHSTRSGSRAGSAWGPGRAAARGPTAVGALAMQTVKEALPPVVERRREVVEPNFFAKTEDGLPLRNVILPTGLIPAFVKRAEANTRRGIETCGLLMGTLAHNSFTITHLLIPKQEGTSDTCSTTHEEEQFAFQDERELMTLGWIHTHPSQSCFMSSLDLHTHCSYQAMLAEAIAIVCSPRHRPSFGIFRLTSPLGIDTIIHCEERGMFHPHPDLPIYTDSDPKYGHARMREIAFETHDLRK